MKNIKKIIFAFVLFFSAYNLFSQENIRDFLETINAGNYVIDFYCDVLKSGNRDMIHKFSDIYVDKTVPDPDYITWEFKWYDWKIFPLENVKIKIDKRTNNIDEEYFEISNHGIYPRVFNGGNIIEISFKEDIYNSDFDNQSSLNWNPVRNKQINSFFFRFDGDYLYVYLNEKKEDALFAIFININDKTFEEFKNLILTNKCDLSKVTWPRHADGTCDYDDSSKTIVLQKTSTNVAPNKVMTVSENLKLRSAEATSSNVLTVMSAGTKVKVLELGKEETIDGINSNWVKVEVISGKDRDGNKLKVGLSGWCYGGYLE